MTLLSRVSDGLPLAASMEDEKDHRELDGYKAQAKKLLKTMNNGAPARVSVESRGAGAHGVPPSRVCAFRTWICSVNRHTVTAVVPT